MGEKKIDLVVLDMAGTTIEDRGEVLQAFTGAMQKNRIPIDEDFIQFIQGSALPLACSRAMTSVAASSTTA